MSDYYFVRTLGGALMPCDAEAEAIVASFGSGEIVRCEIRRDRNPGHHRKFFAILGLVFKNQETYLSVEALRFAVMISAGYVDEISIGGGKVAFKPRSISWAKMDQTDFDRLYSAALEAIPRLLPAFDGIDLDRQLLMSTIGV